MSLCRYPCILFTAALSSGIFAIDAESALAQHLHVDGKVGVNTTSPSFRLDVRGSDGWIGSGDSSQVRRGWRLGKRQGSNPDYWLYLTQGSSPSFGNLKLGALYAGGRIHGGSHQVRGGYRIGRWPADRHADDYLHFVRGDSVRYLNLAVGALYAGGAVRYSSDARLKHKINPIGDALQKLAALRGVTFFWKDPARGSKREVGLIAQQVKKVLPEVVAKGPKGYESVDYARLVPLLIEANKQLSQRTAKLEARLKRQEDTFAARLARLERAVGKRTRIASLTAAAQ